jgi:hypothetical protein
MSAVNRRKTMLRPVFQSLRLFVVLALGGLLAVGAQAQTTAATPESAAKAFYTWHLSQSPSAWVNDNKVFEYIEPLAVKQIRELYLCDDCSYYWDYFTNSRGYEGVSPEGFTVSAPLYSDNKAIVTVCISCKNEESKSHLVVVLVQSDDAWKITEVASANDRLDVPKNPVARFFFRADLQIESKQQILELRRAFNDALTLPIAKLRKQRYVSGYEKGMTFGKIVSAHFLPDYTLLISPPSTETKEFLEATKKPEAISVLKHWLADLDRRIDMILKDE